MGLPNIPLPAMLTDKFCGCLELSMGLRVISLVYGVFWILYSICEMFFGITYVNMIHIILPEFIQHYVAGGWCIFSAIGYFLVVIGIQINNRSMLLPGLLVSIVNIVIALLQAALDILTIVGIFGGILGLIFAVFAAYYTVCLKALYDKMGSTAPPPPMEEQQHFDQV